MATILDGKALSLRLRARLGERVEKLKADTGVVPGLAVILVGDDPASAVYVRNKGIACREAGFHAEETRLPADTSQEALHAAIDQFNADPKIHSILVQLPLPKGLDENAALNHIHPDKDADGLLPLNLGRLLAGLPGPLPCTPHGVMKLLEEAGCDPRGKHAVVVGRSNIVGKPMALLLLRADATVTLCHSRTADLAAEISRADIVVAAVGRPKFVKGEWIKEGAVVIDVGINRGDDGKLCGDVDFDSASKRASAITPVPGGVGPMTIAMLLENAFQAALRAAGIASPEDYG
jgi:methylenetetrahydrofolate dehydrogenase (NADP+) / methenyltetrahydrofolate cyclohydrolase